MAEEIGSPIGSLLNLPNDWPPPGAMLEGGPPAGRFGWLGRVLQLLPLPPVGVACPPLTFFLILQNKWINSYFSLHSGILVFLEHLGRKGV